MLGISINKGRFEFGKEIGAGSFGSVYYAYDTGRDREVAIKIESSSCKAPQLEFEARLYRALGSYRGLPNLVWYGEEAGCNIMVMDLLGPSLQDLMHFCGPALSLKSVLQIADQALTILEYLHKSGFIHRDIKPANFLVGLEEEIQVIHLIDFGLAKRYWSIKKGQHIPYRVRETRGIIGSARYASINAHGGVELSRRDDLESLAYMLLHFIRGNLPWQHICPMPEGKEQRNEFIGRMKAETKWKDLCLGLPPVFASLLMSACSLEFHEAPNFAMMRAWIKATAERGGIVCDGEFDWTQRREEGEVVEHADDEDRLSCNLSMSSMDSAGDSLDVQQHLGLAPRPEGAGGGSGMCPAAGGPGQGPLARVIMKSAPGKDKDKTDAGLVKAIQTAGVTDASFWKSIKKMGVEHQDEKDDGGTEEGSKADSTDPTS